MMNLVA